MAKLVLLFIAVFIRVQVTAMMKIRVPDGFNAYVGMCQLAAHPSHKVVAEHLHGSIKSCAEACANIRQCASFEFEAPYNSSGEGACQYSSFLCVSTEAISRLHASAAKYQLYFTKAEEAWTKSAGTDANHLNNFDGGGPMYIKTGSCGVTDANNGDDNESQAAPNEVMCYESCLHDPACVSFTMEWTSSGDNDGSVGACITSRHACSFLDLKPVDAGQAQAHTYILVERLKGAKMVGERQQIEVA